MTNMKVDTQNKHVRYFFFYASREHMKLRDHISKRERGAV